jgi:hypothetical protein
LGDRKCPGKPRKSFVGHPDAILFLRISREGVFQATGDYTQNPLPSGSQTTAFLCCGVLLEP